MSTSENKQRNTKIVDEQLDEQMNQTMDDTEEVLDYVFQQELKSKNYLEKVEFFLDIHKKSIVQVDTDNKSSDNIISVGGLQVLNSTSSKNGIVLSTAGLETGPVCITTPEEFLLFKRYCVENKLKYICEDDKDFVNQTIKQLQDYWNTFGPITCVMIYTENNSTFSGHDSEHNGTIDSSNCMNDHIGWDRYPVSFSYMTGQTDYKDVYSDTLGCTEFDLYVLKKIKAYLESIGKEFTDHHFLQYICKDRFNKRKKLNIGKKEILTDVNFNKFIKWVGKQNHTNEFWGNYMKQGIVYRGHTIYKDLKKLFKAIDNANN